MVCLHVYYWQAGFKNIQRHSRAVLVAWGLTICQLAVFDLLGRNVRTLGEEPLTTGGHFVIFDAGQLPSGVLFLPADGWQVRQLRKLVLLR
jgi:hypothetical protein